MTSFQRFENRIPMLLEELAVPSQPDYADDLFARTAATRQRPGWSFPERWLPMSAITRRLAVAPRVPWRLGVALALLLLAAIFVLLVAGSRATKPAPPFGPAANGVIPYMSHGKMYAGDLVSGSSRLLLDAGGDQGNMQFSPDGSRILFVRIGDLNGSPTTNLYVMHSDGSGTEPIKMPTPIFENDRVWFGWTPDSRHVYFIHAVNSVNQLDVFDPTGNGSVQRIDAAAGLTALAYRPPDAKQILFRAPVTSASGIRGFGLFVMNADGSGKHLIAEPAAANAEYDLASATYTPDGSRIFYNRWTSGPTQATGGCCRLFVMNADGSDQHQFVANPGNAWDGDAAVSPDGTWIVFHHEPNGAGPHGVFFTRADGTGPLIESGPPVGGTPLFTWAPDSSKVLMYPLDSSNSNAFLLDPQGGPYATTPWTQDNDIDWQRVALP